MRSYVERAADGIAVWICSFGMVMTLLADKEDFFMLYEVVVNDWGETTYVPTLLGNVLLTVAVLLMLLAAAALTGRCRKAQEAAAGRKMTVRQLAFCAMALALGTVLSEIKLFHFPQGGSVTLLSMLVICLPGYWFGLGAGLMTGLAYGVLQLLIDPYILFPLQLVLDYLLAFGALGLSGIFAARKNGLVKGYVAAVLGRYVFAVLSGWLFFGAYAWEGWAPLPYSMVCNGIYIFSEAALSIAVISLPPVKAALGRIKGIAQQ